VRWAAQREAEIEALRAAIIEAELARAQAENHLLHQRVLNLETALARRLSAASLPRPRRRAKLPTSMRRSRSCNSSFVKCGTGTTTRSARRGADLQGKQPHCEGTASRCPAKRGDQAGRIRGVLGVEERQVCGEAALVRPGGRFSKRRLRPTFGRFVLLKKA
jgi:hypothetical protein